MNPKDIKFHPSGTSLYFIGTGYSNLSSSEHPTRAELDAGYTAGTYQKRKTPCSWWNSSNTYR